MVEPARKLMSVDEFLDWQTRQSENWELDDGVPVLPLKSMTGATQRHDRVTVNIIVSLGNQLRRGPCRPSTDDIALVTGIRSVRRPDITVQCGQADPRAMTSVEPRVLIEVLSPSTMNYDRVKKLEEYKRLPSVRAVLLVDTETPRITVHSRGEGASFDSREYEGLDAVIELACIDARLALADVFEGVHDR
ncbi:Uma2 family endonuclease [Alsobacter sp. SYSU BS001988]